MCAMVVTFGVGHITRQGRLVRARVRGDRPDTRRGSQFGFTANCTLGRPSTRRGVRCIQRLCQEKKRRRETSPRATPLYMFRPVGEPGQFENRSSDMRTVCDNSYSQASTSNKAGVSCNCKKSCDSRRCRCFKNGLECQFIVTAMSTTAEI